MTLIDCKIVLQSEINSNCFSKAMKLSIKLAQCFGLFPISFKDCNSVKLKWFHWRMVYSLITMVLFFLNFLAVVHRDTQKKLNVLNINGIVFEFDVVLHFFIFFKLTTQLPEIMQHFHDFEIKMSGYELCGNMTKNLNKITVIIIGVATIEHTLINVNHLLTCLESQPTKTEAFRTYFAVVSYPAVFDFIEYSVWKGVIIELMGLQKAFIWNFSDIVIMLFGEALRFKLRQIRERIQTISKTKVLDCAPWRSVRKDYLRFVSLCNDVNEKISLMIITCFLINLYFVLVQSFKCLKHLEHKVEIAYIYMSFGLLLMRILCIILLGSGVNEEWKNIRSILHTLSLPVYNDEIERFMENVRTQELVLSGKNFFGIRKGLILQIAATIVTYELVLIQFHIDELHGRKPSN